MNFYYGRNTVFDSYASYDGVTSFPRPVFMSGDVSLNQSVGNGRTVYGNGTLFLSEITAGDWLMAADNFYQVESVLSDTELVVSIQGSLPSFVEVTPQKVFSDFCSIDITMIGAGEESTDTIIIDGISYPITRIPSKQSIVRLSFRKGADPRSSRRNFLAPFLIEIKNEGQATVCVAATRY